MSNRNLYDVIEEIKAELNNNNHDLVVSLEAIQKSLSYSAPENFVIWWNRVAELLNDNIKNFDANQINKIADIFSGDKK